MEQMLYILAFMIELSKIMIAFKLVYRKKVDRFVSALVGCVLYTIVIFVSGNHLNYYYYLFASPLVIITAVFSYKDRLIDTIKKIFLQQLFLNAIDTSVKYFIVGFLPVQNLDNIRIAVMKNAISLLLLIVLCCIVWLMDILNQNRRVYRYKMNRELPYVASALLLVQTLIVEWLHSMRKYVENTPKYQRVNLVSTIGYVTIALMMWIVIYLDRVSDSLNDVYEIEKRMGKMKENHYRMLLQKEEETRSYRHDMMNHFICLRQLNEANNPEAVKNYLDQLIGGLKTIQGKNIVVGNLTAEVLLNYYVSALPPGVSVIVLGMVPENILIADAQLCTVLGNILSNAVEELTRLQKGVLKVEFKDGKLFFCMKVTNSVSEKKHIDKNYNVETSKLDKKNHGFGIRNTQEIVEKIGGKMELECSEEDFIATVYLKKEKTAV